MEHFEDKKQQLQQEVQSSLEAIEKILPFERIMFIQGDKYGSENSISVDADVEFKEEADAGSDYTVAELYKGDQLKQLSHLTDRLMDIVASDREAGVVVTNETSDHHLALNNLYVILKEWDFNDEYGGINCAIFKDLELAKKAASRDISVLKNQIESLEKDLERLENSAKNLG